MDLDARRDMNLRVLRRFDPSIAHIVSVASFAVLYSYESGWVRYRSQAKTTTEGPLFLFQREKAPHGLLLLNRNGPVSFSVDIQREDDIEVSQEFIIYRPQAQGVEEDIYGIWIFERAQLAQLGEEMIDEADQAGASVLNSLFENASAQIEKAEEKDGVQGASVNIDELFGGMSTTSSEDKFEEAPEAPEAPGGDAIGESIGTIQLDHRTSAEQARKDTMLEPALEPEPADHAPPADRTAEPSVALLNDTRAEERLPRFLEPLSRREFVQHLMTLLHTDTIYVDQLYARYLAQYNEK